MSYLFIEGKLKGESLGKTSWNSHTWAWRNGTKNLSLGHTQGKASQPWELAISTDFFFILFFKAKTKQEKSEP